MPGCNEPEVGLNNWIGSQRDLDRFLEGTRRHSPSLEWARQGLSASRYWESDFYRANSETLSGWVGSPEGIALVSSEDREGRKLYEAFEQYEDGGIYRFRLLDIQGYIGFADGEAKVLMMMPYSD